MSKTPLKKIIKSKVCDIQTEDLEFVTNTRQQNCLQKCIIARV